MKHNFVKLTSFLLMMMVIVLLVGCKNEITIQFNTNGGSEINELVFDAKEDIKMPITPKKEGYTFEGWYTDENCETEFDENQELEKSITVYAKWKQIEFTVTFNHGEDTVTPVKVKYGEAAIAPTPEDRYGYIFTGWDADFSNVKRDMTINAIYDIDVETTTYTVTFNMPEGIDDVTETVKYENNVSVVPEVPKKEGYVGYWDSFEFFNITADLTVNPVYVAEDDITVAQLFEQSVAESLGNSQVRWVFYQDIQYPLSSFNKEIIGSNDVVSIESDDSLKMKECGTFYMKLSDETSGNSKIYMGVIMPNIYSFNLGSSSNDYLKLEENIDSTIYINKNVESYLVGNSNAYKMDLSVTDSEGADLDEIDLVYSFKLIGDSGTSVIENSKIGIINNDGIIFDSKWIGKTIEITVSPKYYPVIDMGNPVDQSTKFVVEINDGVNVYTDDQLEAAFADLDVHSINIHSNIEPTLRPTQLNPNGAPINFYNVVGKTDTGNPYTRVSTTAINNTCVINGNYFTIDGKDLPFMKPAEDGPEYSGQSGEVSVPGDTDHQYQICSVQNAIFQILMYDNTVDYSFNNSGNSVTFNNLTILGNTKTLDANFGSMTEEQIQQQLELTSQNSGGYNGIVNRHCDVTTNNVVLAYITIGIFGVYGSANININETNIYSCWANGIYGWGAHEFNISKSKISNCGGAAIHMDDIYKEKESDIANADPFLNLDTETEINNLVTGTEPWFRVYGLAGVATTIMGSLESGVRLLTGNQMTILSAYTNPTSGETSNMFNFAIFSRATSNAADLEGDDALNYGGQCQFTLADVTTARPFDFIAKGEDPRIVDGTYIGLASYDVDGSKFMAKVYEYISQGLDQATAGQYALASQFQEAGIGTGYLEVVTAMAGIGQITMLTNVKLASD